MTPRLWLQTVLALVVAAWALWVLEGARAGVTLTTLRVGPTPVTEYRGSGDGPAVVIAHGFAGSQEMMQGYALPLAQAGYRVYTFDFEGHGAHPMPMSGDVSSVDGTTRRLVAQTRAVMEAAEPGPQPVALLGHSMATDVLVRVAAEAPNAGPLVLVSAFSRAIDAQHPQTLLLVTGAWEPGLAAFALDAARMVDPDAADGQTVTAGEVSRQALLAPHAEHVSILHARSARQAALDWLNRAYGRDTGAAIPPTGWALLALLAAITALAGLLARLLPDQPEQPARIPARSFAMLTLTPMLAAPLIAAPVDTQLLPVLVADYLALHLALYGGVQLAVLAWIKPRPAWPHAAGTLLLGIWALLVFGLALDRYGAHFLPNAPRLPIIAALALGTLPFMLADAWACHGAPLWQRLAARAALLASLGIAVALDFEGLFFLLMIAPVVVLFFLTFGTMGRAFARRTGPATPGLALGLVLAWALGVTFPLFAA